MSLVSSTLRRRLIFASQLLAGLVILVAGAGWLTYRHYFPNGFDHCCDKQIALALLTYAETHGGQYPTGGSTPEASLSLLYPKYADAGVLRGKGYPEEPARQLLESGRPLTPETCGWHFVDGLSMQQECGSFIAVFWDKVGSGHNNEYLPGGGHSVCFMDAHGAVISEADWPRFLADQEKAHAAIRRGEKPSRPWVPDRF